MLAVVIAFLFGGRAGYSPAQWIVCIIVGFATLGFADDILDLGAAIRLAAQVVLAGVAATFLSRGISAPQLITIGFIALLIVGYVNAFNFMDGINGISAINAIATGSWYALLGLTYHQDSLLVLGGAVAGAAAGFLPWNAPTARIFMGDVGSYALGSAAILLATVGATTGVPPMLIAAPLVVYLLDTSTTLLRRAYQRERLFTPHRTHVYQRLVDGGRSHIEVAAFVATMSLMTCISAYVASERSAPVGYVLAGGFSLLFLASPHLGRARQERQVDGGS